MTIITIAILKTMMLLLLSWAIPKTEVIQKGAHWWKNNTCAEKKKNNICQILNCKSWIAILRYLYKARRLPIGI